MSDKLHVIDTSAIIDLKLYPQNVFPTLWKNLEEQIASDNLISHSFVLKELKRVDDELHPWFSSEKNRKMFKSSNKEQLEKVTAIQDEFPTLVDHKKEKSVADPFLIALALDHKEAEKRKRKNPRRVVLVCNEKHGSREKTKMPDVCDSYGLPCIKLQALFAELGFKF